MSRRSSSSSGDGDAESRSTSGSTPTACRAACSSTWAAIGSGGDGATMTIELFDYGEPVDIEVPSPDEVTPFTDGLGGFGDGLGARRRDRAHHRGRRVTAGPSRLAVAEAGAGGRPLLLVHGFTGAKEDFTDWLDPLAELGWHAVAPDQRGHGDEQPARRRGGVLASRPSPPTCSALLDALGWERCVAARPLDGRHGRADGDPRGARALRRPRAHGHLAPGAARRPGARRAGRRHRSRRGHRRRDGGPGRPRAPSSRSAPAAHQRLLDDPRPGYKEFGAPQDAGVVAGHVRGHAHRRSPTPSGVDRLADLAARRPCPRSCSWARRTRPFLKPSRRMAEAIPGAELVVLPDGRPLPAVREPRAVVEGAQRLPRPRLRRLAGLVEEALGLHDRPG